MKDQWLNDPCEELEKLYETNQHSRYNKIKELTKKRKWHKGGDGYRGGGTKME